MQALLIDKLDVYFFSSGWHCLHVIGAAPGSLDFNFLLLLNFLWQLLQLS
jgi:hypothetical protein